MGDAFYDISYPMSSKMAIYPNNPAFTVKRVSDTDKGDAANVSEIIMGSHTGTHIDAPVHFMPEGESLDAVDLGRMNGRAKVFDVTGYSEIGRDLLESRVIREDDIVLFKTDNSLNWECDSILSDYVTLTYDAADHLAGQGVKLVGIDYLTVERPRSKREPERSVHRSLLGNGILIAEGLKLRDVQEGEYEFFCLPLNIKGLDGCPVRCVLRDPVR
ncbi:MAG: cyclase family protein [Lachnospiraceae bacterium]|nr:cyclase family protein [Lachnospiraceae bacterium]